VEYFNRLDAAPRSRNAAAGLQGFARRLRALADLSHKGANRAAAAQLALAWALCGALLMGLAPASDGSHRAHFVGIDRTMLALAAQPGATPAAAVAAEPVILRLQDMTPEQARIWNAANPISAKANPAAKPFHLATSGMLDEARALDCLTAAVYYEAAYETVEGQRAVAQVVLNRMRHPAYPKTVCGVVFQGSERTTGCQFTFTCDGALQRTPNEAVWSRARQVAQAALNGYVMKKVGNATHYHAIYVAPYWSPNLVKVAAIGAHVFYRWTGGWGMPPAFSGRYAGAETEGFQIAALDRLGAGNMVEVDASSNPPPAEEPPPPVAEVEAQPTVSAEAQTQILSVADAAKDAADIIPADQLDWAGRPRARGPSRIAAPGASF
jgi:spore germination cell wall hydrolase CwlJ-like protein